MILSKVIPPASNEILAAELLKYALQESLAPSMNNTGKAMPNAAAILFELLKYSFTSAFLTKIKSTAITKTASAASPAPDCLTIASTNKAREMFIKVNVLKRFVK